MDGPNSISALSLYSLIGSQVSPVILDARRRPAFGADECAGGGKRGPLGGRASIAAMIAIFRFRAEMIQTLPGLLG
jgi:hypothetical protein